MVHGTICFEFVHTSSAKYRIKCTNQFICLSPGSKIQFEFNVHHHKIVPFERIMENNEFLRST